MTPRPTRGRSTVLLLVLLQMAAACFAVDLRHRSVSNSGQFVIYCDDRDARARVVSFVEEVKGEILRTLHENDDWKIPAVVAIEPETDAQAQTVPFDHCNMTVGPLASPELVARFKQLLLGMSYADPALRPLLDLEGLKTWCDGRTSGYTPLESAVDGASAVIVATNHSAFESVLSQLPRKALLVDPWNALGTGQVFSYVAESAAMLGAHSLAGLSLILSGARAAPC